MTRKDFELIARSMRIAVEFCKADGISQMGVVVAVESLADELSSTNPRFDRARFVAACGVQS